MLRDRWFFGRSTEAFTLQWHLTNVCELSCLHCYDRAPRATLGVPQAMAVLRDLAAFCGARRVRPQVCLTGGNPLLYPGFFDVYAEAARAGMGLSILGNPVSRAVVDRIMDIRRPAYYQVSLEGLREHNDQVRGPGHFDRTLGFLGVLREAGIRSVVMLTLTRNNIDQVLALARLLRGRADRFTFNRISQVGKGASLELPDRDDFIDLLRDWTVASRGDSFLGFKDGLFNLFRRHFGRPSTRGCTGHGCGAAFDFLALLPDGDIHACRKFPSPVGHVLKGGLAAAYDSPTARRYRAGAAPCVWCPLRRSCGGCPAVTYGTGLDPLADRDPFCFREELSKHAARWAQVPGPTA